MTTSSFRFYGDLNDFLQAKRRQLTFSHTFENGSVKDLIESLGVPHTEVSAIFANSLPVDFNHSLAENDSIEVYGFDAPSLPADAVPLRPPYPLASPKFVLDTHLGQLAVYLRMLGFDTLYRNDYADDELARISSSEQRILLTRDKGLLKRSLVVYGYFMRETNPPRQTVEIVRRYNLAEVLIPLKRCIRCNGLLKPVNKEDILDRLEQNTSQFYDVFHICETCNQIYWKGSHYDQMVQFIDDVLKNR